MSKVDRALPKVLILLIVVLSLGVLLYGLRVWDSYNRRKIKELESREALLQEDSGPGATMVGVVEAVNSADGLIVISVGKDDGVSRGSRFSVRRGGELIGKVQVIEVYADLSGARIVDLKDAAQGIRVGDTIASSGD